MTDDDKALVGRLQSLHVWPQIVADYHAAVLTPRQIDKLYEVGRISHDAADRIEALSAENERLEKAIKAQASAVRTLQYNEETEINVLRKQKLEWHRAVTSIDSERKANAILTAEIERLREALREVFEEWAGSEGFIPETAPEGYLLQLTKRMADIARAALGDTK